MPNRGGRRAISWQLAGNYPQLLGAEQGPAGDAASQGVSACRPLHLPQKALCVPDLLAAPARADGGVFSEGEGPRGESLPVPLS